MEYYFLERQFDMIETTETYVSPYSLFMLENYPLNIKKNSIVCDYGSGTGILGIVASYICKKKVVSIEINEEAMMMTRNNHVHNSDPLCDLSFYENGNDCMERFDTIVCNPSSLPDIAEVNHFCNGGPLGMNMILEVIEFSKRTLSKNGNLYIIITSILPRSIAVDKIHGLGLKYCIKSKKIIPFRPHYSNIKQWVDNTSKDGHPEMYYVDNKGQLYEELLLWEVSRGIENG